MPRTNSGRTCTYLAMLGSFLYTAWMHIPSQFLLRRGATLGLFVIASACGTIAGL
jgi:hypothetical protein